MVEYLNKENALEFDKLFKKAIKKHEFEDIRLMENEKCILLFKEAQYYVGFLEGIVEKDSISNGNIGHILALYVLPSFRNEGKAYSMVSEFEEWIQKRNCKDILVGMSVKNKKSLDFFEKVSFQNIGTCVYFKKRINQN